ncbi:MAG: hypothetical protein ACXU86_22125 [Archangium sp.]
MGFFSRSLVRQSASSSPGFPEHLKLDRLEVACHDCGRESVFRFQVDTHSQDEGLHSRGRGNPPGRSCTLPRIAAVRRSASEGAATGM